MISDIEAGACHNQMLEQARDTQLRIKLLPGNMVAMLRDGAWRRLIRPLDKRLFENRTIKDWILGEPWAGLAFPDWATLYALLGKNIEYGRECMELLRDVEAPSLEEAEREFLAKLAKVKGQAAANGERGRGRTNSY